MKSRWAYLAIIAILGFSTGATAASSEPGQNATTAEMDGIVVTATKVPMKKSDITQEVDIINEAQIESTVSGHRNLADLLTYIPGFFINPLSRNDANWGAAGGLPHKYNTYMLDGLPIDSFVDPQSLDPWAFQRIEVQRGPASVLYPNYMFMDFAGNQAPLAGTVNFILKDRIDSPMTKIEAEGGSYNTGAGKAYHQNRIGDFHFFVGGALESSSYTNYGTNNSWLKMIDDPGYLKTKFYGQGTYFFNNSDDHKLSMFAHYNSQDGDAGRPNRDFNHEYATVNAKYQVPLGPDVMMQTKMGFRHYDRSWEEDNFPDLRKREVDAVRQTILPGDLAFTFKHLNGGLMTAGVDFQHAAYETTVEWPQKSTGNDATAFQTGVYLQEEYKWNDWVFRAGGRYNYTEHNYDLIGGSVPSVDNPSWDKLLWSAGVRYNVLKELSLYTNAGSSFVAPGIMSIGGTLDVEDRGVAGKNGRLPNPDLKPESGIAWDFGINYQVTPALFLGVRTFLNKVDDQIVQVVVSEEPSQAMDINAGKATSYGVEFELKHRVTNWLQWFANYTYTSSEVENPRNFDQDGVQLPFVPEHMGNIGIKTFLPYDITASLWLHVAGEIYDSNSKTNRNKFDHYEVLNAKIEKILVKEEHYKVDAYMNLYNITNNQYEMPWQFQDPGFAASAGLRVVF